MKITCPDCSTSYEIKAEAVGSQGRSVKCAKCGNRWFVSPDNDNDGPDSFEDTDAGADTDQKSEEAARDEADWAADAKADTDEDAATDETATDDSDADAGDADTSDDVEFSSPSEDESENTDEDKFSADLADDEAEGEADAPEDVESRAKRPKIVVNPDKFRRNHIGAILSWVARRNFRRLGGILIFTLALGALASFVFMRDSMVKQSPDLASLFQIIGFEVNLRGLEFRNLRTFSEIEAGKKVLVVEGSIRNLADETNAVPAVRLSIRNSDLQEVYAWTVEPRTKALNGLDETRFRTILADPPEEASDIQVRFIDRGKRQIVLE
ncbi:zinc-ribbon domain-containing protein [uncultured Roseibium sp.]|uniref:zinc-ribbon domain-containing protein n=1 Tax=uncultured Roseibium sp. TaxID=1936171 RepID=UPI00262FA2E1|nr:zinc-ribbon domain-containing protein [uncultured Roseibium sp.]